MQLPNLILDSRHSQPSLNSAEPVAIPCLQSELGMRLSECGSRGHARMHFSRLSGHFGGPDPLCLAPFYVKCLEGIIMSVVMAGMCKQMKRL